MKRYLLVLGLLCMAAFAGSIAAQELSIDQDEYLRKDRVHLNVTFGSERHSIQVNDPSGDRYIIDSVNATGTSSFNFTVHNETGKYMVYATGYNLSENGSINGTVLMANGSFDVVEPVFDITGIDVRGNTTDEPVYINVTVNNTGGWKGMGYVEVHASNSTNTTFIGNKTVSINGSHSVTLKYEWTPTEEGKYNITALAMIAEPEVSHDNVESMTVQTKIKKKVKEDDKPKPKPQKEEENDLIPIIAIISSGLLGAAAIIGLVDNNKYAFATMIIPLYHRVGRDEMLDNEIRGMVYGYIVANPGVNYTGIKDALNMPNGTLAYHLKVLQRTGLVVSIRDGPYRLFYTKAMKPINGTKRTPNRTQLKIVDLIEEHPGQTQKDLAKALGLTQAAISYNLKTLEKEGVVKSIGRKNIKYILAPGPVIFECPYCSAEFKTDTASFCPKCGKTLDFTAKNGNGHQRWR